MGRKGKAGPKRQRDLRARRENSVEAFEAAGVTFVRHGKNIYASSSRSAEEHQELMTVVREEVLPRLRDECQQLSDRLHEILDQADSVDLLARASFWYLPIDLDTYKEPESDRGSAHIEYLALQVLPNSTSEPQASDPMEAASLTGEVVHLARELFAAESQILTLEQAGNPASVDDQARQYQARTRLESMSIRGSGYAEHLHHILLGTLGPFDADCERLLGFTAQQALDLMMAIVAVINDRLEPIGQKAQTAQQEMLRQLPRQRRKGLPGPVPGWIVALKPTEAKQWIAMITRTWAFADARFLATVTPAEIAAASSLPEENARAFLEAFTCPPAAYNRAHHRLPTGAHPLTEKPVLCVQGGYMLPVPSSMTEAIRPRMEDLLQKADTGVWERYAKRRADYLEKEAVSRLAAALPGARGSMALKWKSPSDESDLDGLVAVDVFTLRLQGKAGRLHAPTRRGAPERMKQNLAELIKEAARQHAALAEALDLEGATAIGLGDHREALERAPFQIEVIVCLDDMTVWSTHSHQLQQIGILPNDRPIPWILSLADLMAVTDLLQGAQLLQYITRRLRLEAIGKIVAHDELDWVGHYIDRGLYFEDLLNGEDALSEYRLLSFTEPIDAWYFSREGLRTVPAPKPAQEIPPNVAAMISRLETERPDHWAAGAMALLMGDYESRQLWEKSLTHAIGRRFSHGWSNATQVLDGVAGVSYYMGYRTSPDQFRREFAAYVEQKIDRGQAPNWIAIGDSGRDRLKVVIRTVEHHSITEAFSLAGMPRAGPHIDATS